MVEPVTPNKGYTIPNTGDLPNAWGPVLNTNFNLIDSNVSGQSTVLISSGTYILTGTQAASYLITLTGTLTGNCTIVVPQKASAFLFSDATTRNGYSITISTAAVGGRTQNIPAAMSHHYTDGAGVYMVSPNRGDIGIIKPFGGSAAPPLHLLCYGQAISRTGYSDLFAAIGTTWGAGDGSTTFNVPDLRGRSLFGLDNMGGANAARLSAVLASTTLGAAGGNQLLQLHSHGVVDPGHNHVINNPAHAHGISDPGHNHGVSDPGHTHQYASNSQTVGVNSAGGGNGFLTINGTGTTSWSGTGISLSGAYTGVSVQAAGTSISANPAATGISLGTSGSGNSQNVPPAAMVNHIIFAGA